jgi:hypothetical protein
MIVTLDSKRRLTVPPVIGEEERQSMKEKIRYTNEPLGKLRIIEDFLPPPPGARIQPRKRQSNHRLKQSQRGLLQEGSEKARHPVPKDDS